VVDLSAAPDLEDPLRLSECLPLLGAALRDLGDRPQEKP
jgi:hypothetical protein